MPVNYVRENVPLSRFGILVAQLESIVASASHKLPDPLLCFDLLSDLISSIHQEPKESVLLWQRKCEDALFSLLILGAKRPVRHLASAAMGKIIYKGDHISIYSRVSSLQGFLSDGKKSESLRIAGAARCLGELYRLFGKKITSGLLGTTSIVTKLMKFSEDFVRREALQMLRNALEGSGGNGSIPAYAEAFRIIMRSGVGDKSFIVRKAAARCLKAFANIGGPGLGAGELDNSLSHCVKALEDSESSVRDAFAEALGALLALAMNSQAQVQPKGKGHSNPKKLEGSLQKHLILPFTKASGPRTKNLRIGLTFSWVFFLQAIRLKYMQPDSELQNYLVQIMDILSADSSVDAQSLACVYYILRVGVIDQMTEPTQRAFLVNLGKQLQAPDASPSMKIAALRTLSYALKTLGEVPVEFKEVLDDTAVAALSNSSPLVRAESALTLRTLAEIDPTCVGGLVNYGVTTLKALRENVAFEKGNNLILELDSLSGQATVLAALASVSPKLPLGYPARLPRTMLDVARKMLTEASRNPMVATVEKEAGWLLLSSLLSSMPKEEMEDQVFDILSLWTDVFSRVQDQVNSPEELSYKIRVSSAAIDALIAFIRCFVSQDAVNKGILLQPVLLYLNRALSYIFSLSAKDNDVMASMDILISRTLIAYQSLYDPMAYKSDHPQLIQLCTSPFREASKYEESSYLRILLDSRDAWLGPWVPGRDWFEDELRAFQGGKDGVLPCVWENEIPNFPQPETISKMLVNQMLLCFGVMFATQDSSGMLSLLNILEQCLKSGKKHALHATSVTNVCVGLLSGLKATLTLRPQPLEMEILNAVQGIFQSILAEGGICESQRRAASEGLGLLARLGNDMFTARLTRSLLGDLTGATDSHYAGSIALTLGCIHRSAGGMALSSLVPSTVNSISSLAKSSKATLQVWALHGLLLTIEAAGLSYVSQVQSTLGLAMEILLSEENGWVVLQQGVCRLVNAIVAVLGPELHPGSIFFSRCKSVIAEISSQQETTTLLESVRFSQQLVLFAPQAVTVHSHVKVLLSTLSSRQPTLRHLAVSTLRHLIEKDPDPIIDEQIEENLFHMLDEETDTEIGSLVKTTIKRLLYASCPSFPSRWLSICRNLVLATSSGITRANKELDDDPVGGPDGDTSFGEDDENMVSSSRGLPGADSSRDKHLRYRTRVFAAECLSHVPDAVGHNPAHFDISLARSQSANMASADWLVLQVQELISLAYQISTIQFENMRPIGVGLLNTILDKFGKVPDPELPGHLLLEQNQAQLVSAVRTALDTASGPVLLEAGLLLASKILTSGMISGDQLAVKRIFALISQPLEDFKDLYFPSFAEWVSCKIKLRLLTAHASLKCYTYAFLRRHESIPEEYLGLLPLFSKNSNTLGNYWLSLLKDYSYVCFRTRPHIHWAPFLDGIQSSLVVKKLKHCLEESWPFILQAVSLDAVPVDGEASISSRTVENTSKSAFFSGYNMVELKQQDYQFLWSFSLLVLFQGQHATPDKSIIPLDDLKSKFGSDSPVADRHSVAMKFYEIILPVFGFLSAEKFFATGFLTIDLCRELLQVFSYYIFMEDMFDSHAISVLSQIVQNCPKDFFETGDFAYQAAELCLSFMFKFLQSSDVTPSSPSNWEEKMSLSFTTASNLVMRLEPKKRLQLALSFLLIGYKCVGESSNDACLLKPVEYVQSVVIMLKNLINEKSTLDDDALCYLRTIIRACLNVNVNLTNDCIKNIHLVEDKNTNSSNLPQRKLGFSLEQIFAFASLTYEIERISDNQESKPIFYSMLCLCSNSFHVVLKDQYIQVQAIALQTLTGVIRESNAESNTFLTFFIGELLQDIFGIIKQALKKPVKREAVAVAGDCLKILMLLHTSSKAAESQSSLMSLLLEAIVMVLLASESDFSQEVKELKTASMRLVSQLAQSQISAGYFKDALLSMPSTRRQKLQEIIRASVTQDQISTPTKSSLPPLVIKMPSQTEETRRQISPPLTATKVGEHANDGNEEEDEEEDDWDTFQSFSASTNEPKSTENVIPDNTASMTKSSSTSTTSSEDEDEELENYSPFTEGFKFQFNQDPVNENNVDEGEDEDEEEEYEDEDENDEEIESIDNQEGVDLYKNSREYNSGGGDEDEEVTNENILDQLSKVLTDMAEESSKSSSSTSESDSEEKRSSHSNPASQKDECEQDDSQSGNEEKGSTNSSVDEDFSGPHSAAQFLDEEKKPTSASEKYETEQAEDFIGHDSTQSVQEEKRSTHSSADEDFIGQDSNSQFVNEEKESTRSNVASEKDEPEQEKSVDEEKRLTHSSADEDLSGQQSTFQFVNDEEESDSNAASEKDEREKDEGFCGQQSTFQAVNEEKGSSHTNATLEKDEHEQEGAFSEQHPTAQNVNEEKHSTHSSFSLEKDEPERVEDFSGQDSTLQSVDEERSTHSSADADLSGQHSASPVMNVENESIHSNAALDNDELKQEDFSGQHLNLQSVNEEIESTKRSDALEQDKLEKDSDFSGQDSSVNEEKGPLHSNATEQEAFSSQHTISQSGNEEKGSAHSNVASEEDNREQDEGLSGRHSLQQAED